MTNKNNFGAFLYKNLQTFLFTIILVPIVVFFLFCFIPIYIYRWMVSKLGPRIHSDYGKIMTALGSYYGAECDKIPIQTSSTYCSSMKIAGSVTVEQLREDFLQKVILLKDANNGVLKYPELQQYYEKFMGYIFFKWDRNFNIENHIRYYSEVENPSAVDEDQFIIIRRELAEKHFQENKSPWEIVILKNFKRSDDNSDTQFCVLFLRFHHGLADGFSFTKLLLTTGVLHTKDQTDLIRHKENAVGKLKLFLQFLSNIFNMIIMPFKIVHHVRSSKDECNYFHVREENLARVYCAVESKQISMQMVKEIQNLHQVSYTSVIFAAFGGAIRKYMQEKHSTVPDLIRFGSPIALEGHPSKLRNHATAGLFQIPLGIADPLERLKKINENVHLTTRSSTAVYINILARIILMLPVNWTKAIVVTGGMTLGISTLPGPKSTVWYREFPLTEVGSSIASVRNNMQFGSSLVSYNGGFNIALGGDQSIFKTKEDVKHLLNLLEQEFQVLKYYNGKIV